MWRQSPLTDTKLPLSAPRGVLPGLMHGGIKQVVIAVTDVTGLLTQAAFHQPGRPAARQEAGMHRIMLFGVVALGLLAILTGVPGQPAEFNQAAADGTVCHGRAARDGTAQALRRPAVVDPQDPHGSRGLLVADATKSASRPA
jgi:hypothetical protein